MILFINKSVSVHTMACCRLGHNISSEPKITMFQVHWGITGLGARASIFNQRIVLPNKTAKIWYFAMSLVLYLTLRTGCSCLTAIPRSFLSSKHSCHVEECQNLLLAYSGIGMLTDYVTDTIQLMVNTRHLWPCPMQLTIRQLLTTTYIFITPLRFAPTTYVSIMHADVLMSNTRQIISNFCVDLHFSAIALRKR